MITNDVALALVVLKVLGEQIKTGKTIADGEIRSSAQPEDRTAALLPNGTKVGTVSLTNGRTAAKVVDRAAFTTWVQDTYPSEVEMVATVRPAFEKRLLDECKAAGAPVDGNGVEVSGVDLFHGDPYPMVKVAPGGDGEIAAAYQAGQLVEVMARFTQPAIEQGGDQ